jgi:hypothetical protein
MPCLCDVGIVLVLVLVLVFVPVIDHHHHQQHHTLCVVQRRQHHCRHHYMWAFCLPLMLRPNLTLYMRQRVGLSPSGGTDGTVFRYHLPEKGATRLAVLILPPPVRAHELQRVPARCQRCNTNRVPRMRPSITAATNDRHLRILQRR